MKSIILISLLFTSWTLFAETRGESCGRRQDPLAHLSGIQRVICEKALRAGYSLKDAGCENPNVAWYENRDNSMSDIDDEVAKAMVFIDSRRGYVQGIKLDCPAAPNTYITTSHTFVSSDGEFSPKENLRYIDPYPLEDDNYFNDFSQASYTSPKLDDPSRLEDRSADYLFVSLPNASPENQAVRGIRPMKASSRHLIEDDQAGRLEVYLYRPKTRYNTDSMGRPDFNSETWAREFDDLKRVYDVPQRVNRRCSLSEVRGFPDFISTDCPSEDSVSGSSYIARVNGQAYYVGLHTWGAERLSPSADSNKVQPNGFLKSEAFCQDYEKVCGQPCVDYESIRRDEEQIVSL